MNRTAQMLIAVAIIVLAGFMYLKSRPAPEEVENPNVVPTVTPTVADATSAAVINNQEKNAMTAKQYSAAPEMKIDPKKTYTATMKTSKGVMNFKLFASETPKTVNNFVFLAREGFYDGTGFHRIISGFMIQGGDPAGNGTGGPGYKFADEPVTRDYKRGILAMANAGPNTNGSQFFVMHADTPLPKNYVIFGEIADADSLKTVDAIAATPVNGEAPKEKVVIESVEVEEK